MSQKRLARTGEKTMEIKIKEICFGTEAYEEAFCLRSKVLREPEGKKLEKREVPFDRESVYFAAYCGQDMVGVVLWYRDNTREMGIVKHLAVLEKARGFHIGQLLMERAEKSMIQCGIRSAALKARVSAKLFYESMGYQATGPVICDKIDHVMMEKTLLNDESTLVYLIRHGMTDDNLNGVLQGSRDVPLGKDGVKQATCLQARFCKTRIDALYASPLSRAYETAVILGRPHALTPVTDKRLSEACCGLMEGNSSERNNQLYPEQMYHLKHHPTAFCPPEGESGLQVYDRMVKAMNEIARKNQGKNIAVVSHGFSIELYLGYAKRVPINLIENYIVENCAVSTLIYSADGNVRLLQVNDTSHLPDSLRFHTEAAFSLHI